MGRSLGISPTQYVAQLTLCVTVISVLEVYQFARDAAVAEAWIMAQEPYLISREFGRNLEEVIGLIKKHEAFEKSAHAQDERFLALEKLTTVCFL